jgi:hypothetical protein
MDGITTIVRCGSEDLSSLHVRGTFVDTLASPFEYTDNKIFGEIVVQLRKWWCRFDDLDSAKFRVG